MRACVSCFWISNALTPKQFYRVHACLTKIVPFRNIVCCVGYCISNCIQQQQQYIPLKQIYVRCNGQLLASIYHRDLDRFIYYILWTVYLSLFLFSSKPETRLGLFDSATRKVEWVNECHHEKPNQYSHHHSLLLTFMLMLARYIDTTFMVSVVIVVTLCLHACLVLTCSIESIIIIIDCTLLILNILLLYYCYIVTLIYIYVYIYVWIYLI